VVDIHEIEDASHDVIRACVDETAQSLEVEIMGSCLSHPENESAMSIGTIEIQSKYRMTAPRKTGGEDYLTIH
jgi:hypothetical protein